MDPVEYLRQLVRDALPYVESWIDTEIHPSGKVPASLGTKDEHTKLIRLMREEAVKKGPA